MTRAILATLLFLLASSVASASSDDVVYLPPPVVHDLLLRLGVMPGWGLAVGQTWRQVAVYREDELVPVNHLWLQEVYRALAAHEARPDAKGK